MKRTSFVVMGVMVASLLWTPVVFGASAMQPATTPSTKTIDLTPPTSNASAPAMAQKVEYTLPYPGILPDNPLYFLKQLRDTVMQWLIADPIRKIEFYVLQSDKETNAGVFLNTAGKQTLAKEAIERASKYTGLAIDGLNSLKSQGKEVPSFVVENLGNSLAKHEEVLSEVADKAAASDKQAYISALGEVKKFEAQVENLK